MATKINSAKTKPGSWDVYDDVDAFVVAVLEKMTKIERESHKKKTAEEPLKNENSKRYIMAIWSVCFAGMQWRTIAFLMKISHNTLFSFFSRWTRYGLWSRLQRDLFKQWRAACGDTECPTALIIDSRSCKSSPTCGQRGIDGGKNIEGIKVHIAVDKHGALYETFISTANVHDTVGAIPILDSLQKQGFQGTVLGDKGYRGKKLAKAANDRGLKMVSTASGNGQEFIPNEIRWVVERAFAWMSRYRRLNTIFDRTTEHLVAFIQIAYISILARRINRIIKH